MHINELPLELFGHIFQFLTAKEMIQASMVCQFWHEAALGSLTHLLVHCVNSFTLPYRDRTDSNYFSLSDDLKDLGMFYKRTLKKNVDWWDLLALLPKLKNLNIVVEHLETVVLDAIICHVPKIEHLFLSMEYQRGYYDWKTFGSKLTSLRSLKVEFHWEGYSDCDLWNMIPSCPNLRKIDIGFSFITDSWRKLIPKRVNDVRFESCKGSPADGLLTFVHEEPESIQRFCWQENENIRSQLNPNDLMPLVNVKHLMLHTGRPSTTGQSFEVAVFKYCKGLEYLYMRVLDLKELETEGQVLPNLKELEVRFLYGDEEDLKLYCPNISKMFVHYYDEG